MTVGSDAGGSEPAMERRAGPQLREPRQFARASVRSLRASLPVARRVFSRDLRARYRLSALGFAWIVLPPLAQTAVWLILNEANIINSGETTIPLPLYVLVGTLLWQAFVDALFAPGNQLNASLSVLAHISFPAESLVLAGVADAAVNSVVRLAIAAPLLVYYGVVPGWGLLLVPLGLGLLLLLGLAIGLAIAPFATLYQDLSRTLTVAAGFWLLITPVAYVIPTSGATRWLIRLNPVTPALDATRDWLTAGPIAPGWPLVAVGVASCVLLLVGWVVFRLAVPHLIDRTGS